MIEALPVRCPWCGERFETALDPSAGEGSYVEDCQVCCRPILFQPNSPDGGVAGVRVEREE